MTLQFLIIPHHLLGQYRVWQRPLQRLDSHWVRVSVEVTQRREVVRQVEEVGFLEVVAVEHVVVV